MNRHGEKARALLFLWGRYSRNFDKRVSLPAISGSCPSLESKLFYERLGLKMESPTGQPERVATVFRFRFADDKLSRAMANVTEDPLLELTGVMRGAIREGAKAFLHELRKDRDSGQRDDRDFLGWMRPTISSCPSLPSASVGITSVSCVHQWPMPILAYLIVVEHLRRRPAFGSAHGKGLALHRRRPIADR